MQWSNFGCSILVSLGLISLTSVNARADFQLVSGNNPQPNLENVLLGDDSIGMQVSGATNQTGTSVLFDSATQFLASPSSGQARIEARDANDVNASQVAIDSDLTISLADPNLAFQSLIVDAFIGGGLGAGGTLSFLVSGVDAGNNAVSETFGPETLGNGANFFTITATDGQLIKSVTLSPDANSSYADLRQIRIGGIIPEPATIILLAGLAPFLLLAWRPRRRG